MMKGTDVNLKMTKVMHSFENLSEGWYENKTAWRSLILIFHTSLIILPCSSLSLHVTLYLVWANLLTKVTHTVISCSFTKFTSKFFSRKAVPIFSCFKAELYWAISQKTILSYHCFLTYINYIRLWESWGQCPIDLWHLNILYNTSFRT